MAGYNHVTLVGRLTKDPDVKTVGDNRLRTSFTLSVNRPYKDSNGKGVYDFFNIVSWGKMAEIGKEYLKKGENVLVDGRIQTRTYEQDNQKKWFTEIVADAFSFLSSKNGNGYKKDVKQEEKQEA